MVGKERLFGISIFLAFLRAVILFSVLPVSRQSRLTSETQHKARAGERHSNMYSGDGRKKKGKRSCVVDVWMWCARAVQWCVERVCGWWMWIVDGYILAPLHIKKQLPLEKARLFAMLVGLFYSQS